MIEKLKIALAIWELLEKPVTGWKHSIPKIVYIAVVNACEGGLPDDYSELSAGEKKFINFLKKALEQLPWETKQGIDLILRPNVFRF